MPTTDHNFGQFEGSDKNRAQSAATMSGAFHIGLTSEIIFSAIPNCIRIDQVESIEVGSAIPDYQEVGAITKTLYDFARAGQVQTGWSGEPAFHHNAAIPNMLRMAP